MRQLYHFVVLWLLSRLAPGAAAAIYQHGREDGATELREFMRRDLLEVQAAAVVERVRQYNHGFRDAMRYLGADEPQDEAPIERVM